MVGGGGRARWRQRHFVLDHGVDDYDGNDGNMDTLLLLFFCIVGSRDMAHTVVIHGRDGFGLPVGGWVGE